jgi:hypothetical protein
LRGKALRDGIAWCLDWAALYDRAGSFAKTLSGGTRRRLNMAAGLIHRPRIVLLDEPTLGVHPQSRNRIFEMVEALRANGATVIYTASGAAGSLLDEAESGALDRILSARVGMTTLLILTMSALGGSMFPRFLMTATMQQVGLLTFNAWAIDGYTKVFWRDEPVWHLAPQVAVLVSAGVLIFLIARRFARRWESV